MTNAELVAALLNCARGKCSSCEQNKRGYSKGCEDDLMFQAARLIEAQQKQIAKLEAQLPKVSEWIERDDGDLIWFKCSVCGKTYNNVLLEMMQGEYHYCPNCGARMKGEQE